MKRKGVLKDVCVCVCDGIQEAGMFQNGSHHRC